MTIEKNVELLRRTMKFVDDAAQRIAPNGMAEWQQGDWRMALYTHEDRGSELEQNRCGTAGCYAGWTAAAAGAAWASDDPTSIHFQHVIDPETGMAVPVWSWAQDQLGLNSFEAADLFRGSNDLDDLHDLVNQYCEEAGE